jgi:hypothetical protein
VGVVGTNLDDVVPLPKRLALFVQHYSVFVKGFGLSDNWLSFLEPVVGCIHCLVSLSLRSGCTSSWFTTMNLRETNGSIVLHVVKASWSSSSTNSCIESSSISLLWDFTILVVLHLVSNFALPSKVLFPIFNAIRWLLSLETLEDCLVFNRNLHQVFATLVTVE